MFTDDRRATLDGPESDSSGWVQRGHSVKVRQLRQQGGGGVLFWALIVYDEVLGPIRVPQGVKLDSEEYFEHLRSSFSPWFAPKN